MPDEPETESEDVAEQGAETAQEQPAGDEDNNP